jgi:hypothetical protein
MNGNLGIGGIEFKMPANEAVVDISHNRTLFVEQFTSLVPLKPEMVKGLTTIAQVFNHFKPSIALEFIDSLGKPVNEKLCFNQLSDFGLKGLEKQSAFLSELAIEKEQYLRIMMQLKTNKLLMTALSDTSAKKALLSSLQAMLNELEESNC